MGLFFASGILNARKGFLKTPEVSTGNPNLQSDFTYEYIGNSVGITGYIGSRLDVVVPTLIDLRPVVAIQEDAFRDKTNITSVVLPSSVLDINESAFRGCLGLLSIQLPQLLRTIGANAFRNCKLLQFTLNLPSTLVSIGDSAFKNCIAQKIFVIPRNIQTISPRTFEGCSELTSVAFDVNSRITSIDASAFMNCAKLVSVNLADMPLQSLGSQAFFGCSVIPSIALPSTLLSIGPEAFSFCPKLARFSLVTPNGSVSAGVFTVVDEVLFQNQGTILFAYPPAKNVSTYTAPDNVIKIAPDAFRAAYRLYRIVLPNSVTEIGERAFSYCTNLSILNSTAGGTFILSTSLMIIKAQAFRNLPLLYRIELPATLQEIGEACFLSSSNLETVIFKSISPPAVLPFAFKSVKSTAFGSYPQRQQGINLWNTYTIADLPLYETSTSASQFTYVQVGQTIEITRYLGTTTVDVLVPSVINGLPVVAINTRAFANRPVGTLIVPEGVLRIGESVFDGCTVTSIQLPNSLLTLGAKAFSRAYNLSSVNIPPQITEILTQTFEYTDGLKQITIPNTVLSITDRAFANCGLNSVSIPSSVVFGISAFRNSTSLQSIVFESGRTTIPSAVCMGCISLNSVTFPNTLDYIGNGAFHGCRSLRTINFPSSTRHIDLGAFSGSGLTGVTFPSSIVYIGQSSFSGLSSLLTVNFPSTPFNIGDSAFRNCPLLTTLVLPNGVSSIGEQAFSSSGLQSVTIGSGLTNVGDGVFYGCSQITSFTVSSQNPNFSSNEFGWFNKNFSTLYFLLPNVTGTVTLPLSTIEVARYAINFCKVSTLNLNTGLTTIQSFNINDCPQLTSVFISRTVTTLNGIYNSNSGLFRACPLLTTITVDPASPNFSTIDNVIFNSTVTRLVFFQKSRTGSYVMPTTVTAASTGALQGISLTSITLSPVFNLEMNTFAGSPLLSNVVITTGINSVYLNAFAGCPNITAITIPSTVTFISSFAISGTFLAAINVNSQNAFFESLDGVLFTKGLVSILLYPPKKSGTSYQIPNNTSRIGDQAFYNVPATLKTIYCGSNLSTISGNFTFATTITKIVSSGKLSNIEFSVYAYNLEYYITTFTPPSLVTSTSGYPFMGKIFYANDASPAWDTFSISSATVEKSPSLFVDTVNDFQTETSNGVTKVTRYVGSLPTAVISENVL